MADRIKPRPSSQYELFKQNLKANSIDQGGAPDMPVETPPENRPNINRGTITAKSNDGHNEINITLETIDEAIFHYFNNAIQPKILVNDDLVNVPVNSFCGVLLVNVEKLSYWFLFVYLSLNVTYSWGALASNLLPKPRFFSILSRFNIISGVWILPPLSR